METASPIRDAALPVRATADRRRAREYALALEALRVPFDVHKDGEAWEFYVPAFERARAERELDSYERENAGWPPRATPFDLVSDGTFGALLWTLALAVFFLAQTRGLFGLDWLAAGRADAAAIRAGEVWRTVTALCLHTDLVHVASNAVFGALFFALVCQILGTPLAAASVLAAGALGNWANALIQDPEHLSIGASTAVFGAIGVLCAHRWQQNARATRFRVQRWIPLVIAFVFLGYLGMPDRSPEAIGPARTDVLAHLTGLAAGLALGAVLGRFGARWSLSRANAWIALASAAAFLGCWAAALAAQGS